MNFSTIEHQVNFYTIEYSHNITCHQINWELSTIKYRHNILLAIKLTITLLNIVII